MVKGITVQDHVSIQARETLEALPIGKQDRVRLEKRREHRSGKGISRDLINERSSTGSFLALFL